MLTHLKPFILSEKLAQQFKSCASSKEILQRLDCNVAHKTVLFSAVIRLYFQGSFPYFQDGC